MLDVLTQEAAQAVFDTDLIVLGVVAQLVASLFLGSAAEKGRPRHLLLEALGGTPGSLSFLRDAIIATCRDLEIPCHERATILTIEGPRFSTRMV